MLIGYVWKEKNMAMISLSQILPEAVTTNSVNRLSSLFSSQT